MPVNSFFQSGQTPHLCKGHMQTKYANEGPPFGCCQKAKPSGSSLTPGLFLGFFYLLSGLVILLLFVFETESPVAQASTPALSASTSPLLVSGCNLLLSQFVLLSVAEKETLSYASRV